MISQDAIDLIVREEVSGQTYYTRHYQNPEWPGGGSGVTIAIGYDLGYASQAKIKADWGALVGPFMLAAMCECAGVKGAAAKSLAAAMHNRISIPWDQAMQVFLSRDIPQWTLASAKALPNFNLLNPTCAGVIVSLDYNRGCSGYDLSGDRFVEMRAIKQAMIQKNFGTIPGLLDSMARLWPNSGVGGRRHREADLFRKGLTLPQTGTAIDTTKTHDTSVIESNRPDKPARTKPPATTAAQHGTAGAIVVGGAGAAVASGASLVHMIEMGVLAAVAAALVWAAIYVYRNPPAD